MRAARINALLHHVEDKVEAREGDLFEPVRGERFDRILFNPPFFRGRAKDTLERAFFGTEVVGRFAEGLRDHLAPGGVCLLLLASSADEAALLADFESRAFSLQVAAKRDLPLRSADALPFDAGLTALLGRGAKARAFSAWERRPDRRDRASS